MQPVALALEGDTQAELDLTGSPERVNACSDAHAIYIVSNTGRPIDLSASSRQQSTSAVPVGNEVQRRIATGTDCTGNRAVSGRSER